MKVLITIFNIIFVFNFSYSQLDLDIQFREYLGIQNAIHSYDSGASDDFPEIEVADDFGPRKLDGDTYNWHGGIDYNNTVGTDNRDDHDLILSPQVGQVANNNGMLRTTRYITIDGDGTDGKNFSYLHLFTEGTLPRTSGGCTLMLMDFPNTTRWCIVFDNNLGAVYAIGQVVGTVSYDGQNIPVGIAVAAGAPIGPVGTSGPGGYHLHLTALENSTDSPYRDNIANNPLEFISYSQPSYDIELLFEDDVTTGVDVSYPGTDFVTIQARVKLDGYDDDARRYNEIYDVEKLYFWMKPSYAGIGQFKQLQGPFYDRIQLGGQEGSPIIPQNMWQDGNGEPEKIGGWNIRTGIEPHTYAGANEMPHPWDDFYFHDFVSRIHKDDIIGDSNPNFRTDTPENARFNDGEYDMFCEVVSIKENSTFGETSVFTLDNFQPFLTNFSLSTDLTANALTIAQFSRSQSENENTLNDGLIVNQNSFAETNEFTETFILSVLTSESMASLQFRHSFENGPNTVWGNMTIDANNPLKWNVEVEDQLGCYLFNFKGEDKSGNPLINVYNLTNENAILESVLIPTRLSTTSWVNNPSMVGEDFYSVCTTPVCESQIENITGSGGSMSDCEDIGEFNALAYVDCQGNYFIELDGLGEGYIIGWLNDEGVFKLGDPSHPASIGQNCYIIENEAGCCSFQGCIEITGEERYADNFTYGFTDGPSGTKTISVSTAADGLSYPIMVDIIGSNSNYSCNRQMSSSQNVPTCLGLVVGEDYCVRYTDANGCVYENCFTTPTESCSDPILITADNIIPECENSYNGAINFIIEGSPCSRYVAKWDNGEVEIGDIGQNEFQLTDLQAGDYCVIVGGVDCSECQTSTCFEVPETSGPCGPVNCEEILANEVLIDTEFIFFNTSTNTCEGGSFNFDASGSSVFPVTITVSSMVDEGCLSIPILELTQFESFGTFGVDCLSFNSQNCAGEYCFNIQRAGCPVTTFCRTIRYCEGESRTSEKLGCLKGDGGQTGNNTVKENLENIPPPTGSNTFEVGLEKITPSPTNNALTLAKIYPNPFTTDINIQLESTDYQTVQLQLVDIHGRMLISESYQLTKGVNLISLQPSTNLASGIYALTITDEHQKKYTRLITRMNN